MASCQQNNQKKESRMKDWISKREQKALKLLSGLGVKSLYQLSKSALLIHLTYGETLNDGRTILVNTSRYCLRRNTISFEFDDFPIKFNLDVMPGKKAGGDLKGFDGNATIMIHTIYYNEDGWSACYECEDTLGEIRENLDVKILVR